MEKMALAKNHIVTLWDKWHHICQETSVILMGETGKNGKVITSKNLPQ
jgi:hypothetical protein